MSVPVLLTDGEQRSTLAAVRSLGRAGFRPYVAAGSSRSLAAASRFAVESAATADPLSEPDRFVADLVPLIDRWGIRILLPMTDASHLALLPARESFPGVCIPCPDWADFERISDKAALLERASKLGIGIPRQAVLDGPGDASAASALGFPLVIKPRTSIGGVGAGRARRTASLVPDLDTLETELRQLPPEAYPVLAQERIEGPGVGVFLLIWDGELLAAFSHRRLREKPPWGGVSVYRESHPLDRTLLDQSRRLLETHSWRGVAMVEYKLDAETGQAYLMEVNGRLWGSLQLAIDAGVDFPALLLRSALGDLPRPVLDFRAGVRCRWWWGDVDHLLTCLKGGASAGAQPGRGRALLEFLKLWRPGDRSEVFRVSDPRPFLRESALWVRALR